MIIFALLAAGSDADGLHEDLDTQQDLLMNKAGRSARFFIPPIVKSSICTMQLTSLCHCLAQIVWMLMPVSWTPMLPLGLSSHRKVWFASA